jgi:hypothetical protein
MELPNIKLWCKQYQERANIKIFEQSVPVNLVLEDLLGSLQTLKKYHDNLVSIYNNLNERVSALEQEQKQKKQKASKQK